MHSSYTYTYLLKRLRDARLRGNPLLAAYYQKQLATYEARKVKEPTHA